MEMMKIVKEFFAELLITICNKCGELKDLRKHWQTGIFVPMHKKGETSDPANYRPIAVRSHARKMIEKPNAIEVRSCHRVHETQLGLQEGISTETAILMHIAGTRKLKIGVVLDLNQTYDRVPRDLMMKAVKL